MGKWPVTHIVSIYQLQRSGNNESYPNIPTYTSCNAAIVQIDTKIAAAFGGIPAYSLYNITLYDTTLSLNNGDKLVDQNSTEYIVDGRPVLLSFGSTQVIRILGKVKV